MVCQCGNCVWCNEPHSQQEEKMSHKETIEEFLQRGGNITKCDPGPAPDDEQKVQSTTGAGSAMMSLAEGSIYYAEIKEKKAKKKPPLPELNLAVIPAHLLKYVKN